MSIQWRLGEPSYDAIWALEWTKGEHWDDGRQIGTTHRRRDARSVCASGFHPQWFNLVNGAQQRLLVCVCVSALTGGRNAALTDQRAVSHSFRNR